MVNRVDKESLTEKLTYEQRPEGSPENSHVDILGRTVPGGGSASAKALRQKCGLSDLGHAWETAVGCGVSKIHRDLVRVPKGLGLLFGEPCNATEVPVAEANMIWLLC